MVALQFLHQKTVTYAHALRMLIEIECDIITGYALAPEIVAYLRFSRAGAVNRRPYSVSINKGIKCPDLTRFFVLMSKTHLMKPIPNSYFFVFRRPNEGPAPTAQEMQLNFERWSTWIEGLRASGKCVGGHPLQSDGKVLRRSSGVVTDGPFLEGKEICGGFIAIVARDIEEATELARGCPGYATGHSVEIRKLPEPYLGPVDSRPKDGPGFLFAFRDPARGASANKEQVEALMAWIDRLKVQGRVLAQGPLEGTPARVLRGARGEHMTDGPFAEGKEVFAGYMVIKAKGLEVASNLASTCPILDGGTSIEVRTIGFS